MMLLIANLCHLSQVIEFVEMMSDFIVTTNEPRRNGNTWFLPKLRKHNFNTFHYKQENTYH